MARPGPRATDARERDARELGPRELGPRELGVALGAAAVWAMVVRPGPLSLPYFWDEGDVYAAGARWLAEHDLDATPGRFPDDWSRGHPPLFFVVAGIAFRIAGAGPAVGHALVVPFTAVALAITYALGAERAGRAAGVVAAGALACSPLFMTMGAFLLPEMPLTALTVVALWCASRGWLGRAAICGVALVWIKETGVGVPIAIACGVALEAWRERRLGAAARAIAISASPVLALLAFFAWQRATAGYFVFPHHAGLLTAQSFALGRVGEVLASVLAWDGRWALVAIAVGSLALAVARRRAWPAALRPDATNAAILVLLAGNALFFGKMFWLERYALPVHPGVAVWIGAAIAAGAAAVPRPWTLWACTAVPAAIGLASMRAPSSAPEHTFAFAAMVERDRDAIARIAAAGARGAIVTTWPLTSELREPWLGYAPRAIDAVHPDRAAGAELAGVLVDESSRRSEELRALARDRRMRVRWAIERDGAPRLELWAP